MIRIGITGGLASGKSTALELLRELGCHTISSDDINRELLKNDKRLIEQIKILFKCVDDNGVVNKQALGKIIFNDEKAKKQLEDLIHPLIKIVRKDFFKKCEIQGGQFAVCESPLLFEKELMAEFEYTIIITASLDIRIDRFIASGWTQEQFFNITKNQFLDKHKQQMADFVIKNNKTKIDLKKELKFVLEKIIEDRKKKI